MHFTYKQPSGDLQQGDLLEFTEDLRVVLHEYHNYYSNHTSYRFLMVLTQSCDLARRNDSPCKSRYVTLTAVRPAEQVLYRELSKFQNSVVERESRMLALDVRERAADIIERLLNNNLPDYFYLEPDPGVGIHEPLVACLSLSIALKAPEHYGKCLSARVAQLEPLFQAKLGWLVGNSFSRVGTPDWTPTYTTEEDFKRRIEEWLENLYIWVDKKAIAFVNSSWSGLRERHGTDYRLTEGDVDQALDEFAAKRESKRDEFTEAVVGHVKGILPAISATELALLRKRLRNASDLSPFLRR